MSSFSVFRFRRQGQGGKRSNWCDKVMDRGGGRWNRFPVVSEYLVQPPPTLERCAPIPDLSMADPFNGVGLTVIRSIFPAMSDELTIIAEGGMSELKEHRELLASQGIASRIVAPPGSGKG